MLRISCPYCGLRDQVEFQFGGETHITRPENPEQANDSEWANYMFYRDNIKGLHYERWVHSFGCRQWFNVARDTVTHEITAVFLMAEQPASAKEGESDGQT